MIARIKTENGYYDSIVFAILSRNSKTEVIVFNENYDQLVSVEIRFKRKVFIYNTETNNDWIVNENKENIKIGL